ncbi:MAG: hypothetical protein H7Y18_19220 [Clostridiaceae bacterium]|nr:hypothetical protein [Clostridiaceae bacterium]
MGKVLSIVDIGTGEQIERIEFSGGYNIQYTTNEDSGRIFHVTKLDNAKYMNKYWIKNESYCLIAQKLINKFEIFKGIRPERILFIEDENYVGSEDNKPEWIMRIKKANAQLTEYTGYCWIIESLEWWVSRISHEQVVALMYSMLKYIDGNSLKKEDIKGWDELIGTLGNGWEHTMSPIPNLLQGFTEEDFKLINKADRQVSVFDGVMKA